MILKYEDIYPKLVLTGTYIADPKVQQDLFRGYILQYFSYHNNNHNKNRHIYPSD